MLWVAGKRSGDARTCAHVGGRGAGLRRV